MLKFKNPTEILCKTNGFLLLNYAVNCEFFGNNKDETCHHASHLGNG